MFGFIFVFLLPPIFRSSNCAK